jgi:methionyl-tRNA synthetase
MSKKVLVAVAWPYVNGDLHLGHLAGYLLPADIFARYRRLMGDDVMMVSGSDCHGTPITVEADKQGIKPLDVVDIYHAKDVELFKLYGLSYNLYTKTTTANHKKVTQDLFLRLLQNDYIIKGTMKQYYSSEDNKFLPDRYVEGTCPHCQAKEQRSDQCEACGRWLSDGELLNPYSKLTKATVELKDTEHYFIDFEKLNAELRTYVDSKKDIWRNWVWSEADGWLREGLQKRAITRDLDWGIELPLEELKKLPADKQLANYDNKKIYVWFEAVIGYLSAPQEWAQYSSEPENYAGIYYKAKGQGNDWQSFWKNPDSEHYYFMGQDNLVFHTLMWPGELIGAKDNYTLPHNVIVNKFMNYEGKKFSKSRNWTIDSKAMAEKYGVDLVRFFMASNFPENKEADFTWNGFVDTINNELVANLGNYINRSLKFFETKFAGKLSVENFVLDAEVLKRTQQAFSEMGERINKAQFVEGVNCLMQYAKFANQYFDQNQIWQVIKTDPDKAQDIMLNQLNIIENLKVLMAPVIPHAAERVNSMLRSDRPSFEVEVGQNFWQFYVAKSFELQELVTILFTKLDKEVVLNEKL